jgi:glucose-6-phosphate 1-epimerase
LHIKNTSSAVDLEFQALFHNYLRAPSNQVLVTGLKDHLYLDKINTTENGNPKEKMETRDTVDVQKLTDSVYENVPHHYKVTWPGGGLNIRTTELKDVVIWNPQETGSKMGDMEDRGW